MNNNQINRGRILIFFLSLFFLLSCNSSVEDKNNPEGIVQDGDIIFHESTSAQSKAIQFATHSKYSHCGIIFKTSKGFHVFEAVQPVQSTPLKKWITRGKGGHYVVRRLKDADNLLTNAATAKMKKFARSLNGKDYDLYFEWSNDKIYCSELVWKIYKEGAGIEVGRLQKLKDFDLTNPVVKQKLTERYGKNTPYDETVISPGSMFDSKLLQTVISN